MTFVTNYTRMVAAAASYDEAVSVADAIILGMSGAGVGATPQVKFTPREVARNHDGTALVEYEVEIFYTTTIDTEAQPEPTPEPDPEPEPTPEPPVEGSV